MGFGLIIIGDEILSGKREDKHFAQVRGLMAARGLRLDWVNYLGDDRERLAGALAHSFASGDIVFSCGGIGGTPDDHTRQAAAAALGLPLVLHPQARELIVGRMAEVGQPLTPDRLSMGEFPEGAEIIPNPFNRIPGFSIRQHHFVPGFPVMAWPMLEWVLDHHYSRLFHGDERAERAMRVEGIAEGTLTPLMRAVEAEFSGIRVFSLPHMDPVRQVAYYIELGVKGPADQVEAAFIRLAEGVAALAARDTVPEERLRQS
ncbi:MAG: molybdopterin-binding protein [Pseudomonadota bacterium]|nr:molybdopterin-binding protein [Pseudomonadota bacterium]MDP1903479.1 molybdopterin-binding protein [Pseudomonadota bacterium]MDP2351564.1 molybdopterin-binding protein [Pseudomonadota bacterium]